ncbi:Glycoprotein 3-alpha-L-fucosyltransferase A, partial [Fragariocoptes setiger]
MKNKNARGCSRNVESLVTRCTVGRLFVTVLIALCLSKLLLELCAIIYSIVNSRVCPLQLKDISSVNIARNQYQYNHQSYYDEQFLWSEQFGWLLLRPNQKYVHIDGLKQSKFVQNKLKIWPEQCQSDDSCDRIIDQLLYQPNDVQASSDFIKIVPPDFGYPEGRKVFVDHKCRVNTCSLTFNTDQADAIIFQNADVGFALKYNKNITNSRRLDQIWIAYLLESPVHTFDRHFERLTRSFYDLFNWTASYRHDSDIVTPYEKFLPYADTADDYYSQARFNKYNYSFIGEQTIELIRGKRKQVVWFSSNCFPNNDRYRYANELKKYINVDIFGRQVFGTISDPYST